MSGAQVDGYRRMNAQLRREKDLDRDKVSVCAEDIIRYCNYHINDDPLVFKVSATENPFVPKKKTCALM